jgi:hypothetical protein
MNPIIFLDIDGVLCINFTKGTEHRNTDKYGDHFDRHNVDQLKRIIDATGANIVISSSWRRAGLQVMKDMWKDRSLPGNVIDITPFDYGSHAWNSWNPYIARGEEIKKWMKVNGYPDRYVIIDDDPDMLDWHQDHFVRTETETGLTSELADRAIEILNKIKGE